MDEQNKTVLQGSTAAVSPSTTISTDMERAAIETYGSYQVLLQKQDEAWQRVSMFILGEELTTSVAKSGKRIVELLDTLLTTIKNGCCSNVGAGYMCGRCESSINVTRISRAIILSICKLPIELDDDITRKELDRLRSRLYNQIKKFISSSKEIQMALPEKLSKLIAKPRDIMPPWEGDDFGILLQQPSPSWIVRINVLMLMGYKVVLVNFNDVARFSRKDLKVVHDDISRLLCPSDNGDDKVNDLKMDRSCTGSEQVDDNSPPVKQESNVKLSDSDEDTIQTDNKTASPAHVESMRDEWLQSSSIEQLLLSADQCVEESSIVVLNNIQYIANNTSYTCKATTDYEAIINMLDALYINGRIHRINIEDAMSDFLLDTLDLDTPEEQHCCIDLFGDIFCAFSMQMQALTITWLADRTERIVENKWNGYTARYSYKFLVIDSALTAILRHIGRDYIKEFDTKDRAALERVLGHSNLPYFKAQLDESPPHPVALASAISKRLYPQINETHPDLANKIAGMLMEIDTVELTNLLDRPKVNFSLRHHRKVLEKVIGHSKYSELSEQFEEFDAKQDQSDLVEEELFKQPPHKKDCPICRQRLPILNTGKKCKECCGKVICSGCIHSHFDDEGNVVVEGTTCPSCSAPEPKSQEEIVERVTARVKLDDAEAISCLGTFYDVGLHGLPQDITKALELWHQAAELGHAHAYADIGLAYSIGEGVKEDKKKATHYCELAAIEGDAIARHELGGDEERAGNEDRALKHWMIAAKDGVSASLEDIKRMYKEGHATKEDYATSLRAYQKYLDEIKSDHRDRAVAYDEDYKYY